MKVSSRMPMAIAMPNWNSSRTGMTVSTANVAARMRPADETTPPVRVSATFMASFGGCRSSSWR